MIQIVLYLLTLYSVASLSGDSPLLYKIGAFLLALLNVLIMVGVQQRVQQLQAQVIALQERIVRLMIGNLFPEAQQAMQAIANALHMEETVEGGDQDAEATG